MRVAGGLQGRIFGGGTHGELVHVHAAERNRPGGAQFADHRGVVGRAVVSGEDLRTAGTGQAERVDVILDGDGNAAQRQTEVRALRLGQRVVQLIGKIGSGAGVAFGNPPGELLEHRRGC